MRWFEGAIPAAIQETKSQRKLLVVYVLDTTEDSSRMTAVLDEDRVSEALTPDNTVALKLESGTDGFAQFSVFYPVLLLPSVYFIGDNGTPLEVVGGHQPVEAFLEKVNNAFKMHGDTSNNLSLATASSTSATTTPTPPEPEVSSATDFAPQEEPCTSSSAPFEDRVLTAKEKMEEQNRERIRKENEETKKREIERRKLGQEMAEAQRLKEETAMRQRAEELAKEKAEEKKAREAIKEQIERDRKERHARFEEEKRIKDQKAKEKLDQKKAEEDAAAAELQARIRSISRIQFRLPDGRAITREFSVDTLFNDLRDFISSELRTTGMENFDLVHSFTRRKFEEGDSTSTLTELDLAGPNALIVVPRRGGGAGGNETTDEAFSLVSIFWIIVTPFIFIVNLLRSFLFGVPQQQRVEDQSTSASTTRVMGNRGDEGIDGSQGARQRRSNREGNVHRLRHDSDSDSDDPTWNGNSTQQL